MMDEKVLEDLLECSVCLGRLTTNSKVLPCQHTFCRRCLEQIVRSKNELRCPECRILVTCSVDELPSNILLVRLLDGIKERRRTATASQGGSPKSSHSRQGGKGASGDAGAASQAQKTPAASRSSPVKVGRLENLQLYVCHNFVCVVKLQPPLNPSPAFPCLIHVNKHSKKGLPQGIHSFVP